MADNAAKEVGRRLRRERERRCLSVADVADRAGCTTTDVYRWELGYHEPRAGTLIKLARAVGCSPGVFFNE